MSYGLLPLEDTVLGLWNVTDQNCKFYRTSPMTGSDFSSALLKFYSMGEYILSVRICQPETDFFRRKSPFFQDNVLSFISLDDAGEMSVRQRIRIRNTSV